MESSLTRVPRCVVETPTDLWTPANPSGAGSQMRGNSASGLSIKSLVQPKSNDDRDQIKRTNKNSSSTPPKSASKFLTWRRTIPGFALFLPLYGLSPSPALAAVGGGPFGGNGGGGDSGGVVKKKSRPVTITLAAFAVARFAYEKLGNIFSQKWEKKTGQKLRFRLSFAGSGSQARAVIDGLPADIVALALPLDVIKIEESGLIDHDWAERLPNHSVPAETTVAIVTRPGNPKNISDWSDLAREDVKVLTANPKTAGVARWNFFSLWGSVVIPKGAKQETEAQTFLEKVFKNVPVQPRDAREASDVFVNQGLADALITYEHEAYLTNQNIIEHGLGSPLPYIVPHTNVRIQTVVAVVDKNARKNGIHDICTEFTRFCFTEEAQHVYAQSGFRPVIDSVFSQYSYPKLNNLWRVEDSLGDWNFLQDKFFADQGMVDRIEKNVGLARALA